MNEIDTMWARVQKRWRNLPVKCAKGCAIAPPSKIIQRTREYYADKVDPTMNQQKLEDSLASNVGFVVAMYCLVECQQGCRIKDANKKTQAMKAVAFVEEVSEKVAIEMIGRLSSSEDGPADLNFFPER